MESLFRITARRGLAWALSFVVLVAILVLANLLVIPALQRHGDEARHLAALASVQPDVVAFRDRTVGAAANRVEGLKSQSQQALEKRIAEIDAEQRALGPAVDVTSPRFLLSSREEKQAELQRNVRRAVLGSERDLLLEIRAYHAGPAALEAHRQWLDAALAAQAAATHAQRARRWWQGSDAELTRLEKASREEVQRAQQAYERQQRAQAVRRMPENALGALTNAGQQVSAQLDAQIAQLDRSLGGKILAAVREASIVAAWILLAAVLTPIAIKALFYFVLAPLAARRPPIQLLPQAAGALEGLPEAPDRAKISSISLPLSLAPAQVLLVQADFLQSSAAGARIDTQWLLDWRYPITSLAAGMVALTRVRGGSDDVVVSSTRDPLIEVGVLRLPEGASFVLQPRCLVGVIHDAAHPLRITSRWRLWSLHAWLTLQLRYLVFHGPADLIVKGSRGVRAERAGNGRRINQAATIGFAANLRYRTSRCETFAAYLFGQRELLNDSFEGDGHYTYQEIPERGRGGIFGRGLTGVADTLLRIVGI